MGTGAPVRLSWEQSVCSLNLRWSIGGGLARKRSNPQIRLLVILGAETLGKNNGWGLLPSLAGVCGVNAQGKHALLYTEPRSRRTWVPWAACGIDCLMHVILGSVCLVSPPPGCNRCPLGRYKLMVGWAGQIGSVPPLVNLKPDPNGSSQPSLDRHSMGLTAVPGSDPWSGPGGLLHNAGSLLSQGL